MLRIPPVVLLGLALLFGPMGCGKKKAPNPAPAPVVISAPGPVLDYQPMGLLLTIRAESDLNFQNDQPHTLAVVLYQLSAVNAFNELAKDPTGLQSLLQGSHFDASVAGVDRLYLQPGVDSSRPLDRAQHAQWLGVVAGYYGLKSGACVRLVGLPETSSQSRTYQAEIDLVFGRNDIKNAAYLRPQDMR